MTYDVPFLRHVTSNKTYNFCIFSNFVNSEPIDLKIGTHIDLTYTIYHIKNRTNKNNITRISMATKYHIIKHRVFFKNVNRGISPIHTGRIPIEIPVHYVCPGRVIKNRLQIKHMIFAYFLLNLVNFVPIDLKIGTHIDCIIQKTATNKNNGTRISMATKYPIIKDRPH